MWIMYRVGVLLVAGPHLHALKHVQEVVHARQMLDVLENGHQQSGYDGDGPGQHDSCKTRPPEVQETLIGN